ncbi:MAG TPA: hypothetical protein VHM20_00465 [Gammaproteobacteria bacterium]|nr:hypothetical protein [Gammaproteobacteria bacterium]
MLTHQQLKIAILNIHVLITHANSPISKLTFQNGRMTKNIFFHSNHKRKIQAYLQTLMNSVAKPDTDFNHPLITTLFIHLLS